MISLILLNIIIYITLFQFLVGVNSQTILNPDFREGHTATFINDKLYILGGSIPIIELPPKETFLYLDFSAPFETDKLEWHDLSNNSIVLSHRYAAAIGDADNSTLILYGGESLDGKTLSLVYTFDTRNNLWNIPEITGTLPAEKIGITPIIDNDGLVYLFGGTVINPITYTNDMLILNTKNLSWTHIDYINASNAPSPRVEYGAVLLPNKNIIYMGGFNPDLGWFTLDVVYLYDTVEDTWTTKETSGTIPSARSGFSTVLGLDGQRVILFGGFENEQENMTPETSLYVLDINNFNWYIPKITGKIPSGRHFHKAVLVGKYMVISFGGGYARTESDILLLDISNNDEYVWTTSFDLSPPVSPPSSTVNVQTDTPHLDPPPSSQYDDTGVISAIAIAIIGSLIAAISLIIGSYFLYKRFKHKDYQQLVMEEVVVTPKKVK